MKAINYIYIPVAELYMEVSKTDPSETRDWMLGVLTAVIKQERGVYELADRIIDEADAFRKKAAERQQAYRERQKANMGTNTWVNQNTLPERTQTPKEQPVQKKPAEPKQDPVKDTFGVFRKMYGGRKDGLETEYARFVRACQKFHLEPKVEVTKLCDAWEKESEARSAAEMRREFYPLPKNLGTWLNNLCWQQEQEKPRVEQKVQNLSQSQRLLIQMGQ